MKKNTLYAFICILSTFYSCTNDFESTDSNEIKTTEVVTYSSSSNSTRYQMENFISQSGTKTETTTDTGGGKDVGFINPNDFLVYSINIDEAGEYNFKFRAATATTGGKINILINSTYKDYINISNDKKGWQSWYTTQNVKIYLNKGWQNIRFEFAGNNQFLFNLNWFELSLENTLSSSTTKDWANVPLPQHLLNNFGTNWKLQENFSDDFNYEFTPSYKETKFGNDKWINRYINKWTGSAPTKWEYQNSYVTKGNLTIKATRITGETTVVDGKTVPMTHLGCVSSVNHLQYPIYVEANVKLCSGQFASDVWMLSDKSNQEIDICEGYGAEKFGWYESIHLSHHVFQLDPRKDYQPTNNRFYKGESKYGTANINWREKYHRIGVYWKDPWNLYYYIDGNLIVHTLKTEIDPYNYLNGTGLNDPEKIIMNMEHQSWLAADGYNTTDEELKVEENRLFKIDWIRAYKPE